MTTAQVINAAEKAYRRSGNADGNYSFAIAATVTTMARNGKISRADAVAAIRSMTLPATVAEREIAAIRAE